MSSPNPTRWLFLLAVPAASFCLLMAAEPAAPKAPDLVRQGQDLYRSGSLGDALLKFEEAVKQGASGGELFYQIGYCYKTVRQDAEKSEEYMKKAAPLLETEKDRPGAGPAPWYYLSYIYLNDLHDAAKGAETARGGVAQAEKGAFGRVKDGDQLFQIGQIYTMAGKPDAANGWYEKAVAAFEAGKKTNAPYMPLAVDQIAGFYMSRQQGDKAAEWLLRKLSLGPVPDAERMSTALLLIRIDRYQEAVAALKGMTDDDLVTEGNYISTAVTRFLNLGAPALPAEAAGLDDAGLQEAIGKAAIKLGEIRKKAAEAAEASKPPEPPPQYREVKLPSGKVIKVPIPNPDAGKPAPAPPPSPEQVAAEKEFFGLLMEALRRGQYLRDLAFARGFTALIFR